MDWSLAQIRRTRGVYDQSCFQFRLTGGFFGLVLIAVVLMLVGAILGIVLFAAKSKPKGARFDK